MIMEDTLKDIPLFKKMSEEEFSRIKPYLRKRKYKKKEVIFLEEDTNQYMYIILEGKVKVIKNGDNGKGQIMSIHKAGDFFGEMSMIDSMTEPATVIAKEDCTLIIISKSNFKKLLHYKGFSEQLLEIFCKRLRSAWERMEWLTLVNASDKVKLMLKFLAENHGDRENGHIKIKIRLTHEELGELAGISRETVSRELNKLKKEGALSANNGHIFINQHSGILDM
jgi:CRP/FNR family cyclic AMP-dependent transcriptional regulator